MDSSPQGVYARPPLALIDTPVLPALPYTLARALLMDIPQRADCYPSRGSTDAPQSPEGYPSPSSGKAAAAGGLAWWPLRARGERVSWARRSALAERLELCLKE